MTPEEKKKLMSGNTQFYDELIDQYSKLLWAVASTILTSSSNRQDLEEVISDVFVRLWQHPEKYDPDKGSIKSYLVVMTKSIALNKLKAKRRHQHKNLEIVDENELILYERTEETAWQELYDAVMQLEEPTRRILIMRFFYEMKPKEIERQLGLSSKEIDNRLYRGKQKLRKLLEQQKILLGGELYD